eukprot:jgi/Mesvir1/26457/Mv16132-RA.1
MAHDDEHKVVEVTSQQLHAHENRIVEIKPSEERALQTTDWKFGSAEARQKLLEITERTEKYVTMCDEVVNGLSSRLHDFLSQHSHEEAVLLDSVEAVSKLEAALHVAGVDPQITELLTQLRERIMGATNRIRSFKYQERALQQTPAYPERGNSYLPVGATPSEFPMGRVAPSLTWEDAKVYELSMLDKVRELVLACQELGQESETVKSIDAWILRLRA